MNKILVQNSIILSENIIEYDGDSIICDDIIYPKHVIENYEIIDIELPDNFTKFDYIFEDGNIKKIS
jgi:hypothetical protein